MSIEKLKSELEDIKSKSDAGNTIGEVFVLFDNDNINDIEPAENDLVIKLDTITEEDR